VGEGDHRTGLIDYDIVLDTLNFEVMPEEGDAGTDSSWARHWDPISFSEFRMAQRQ
jgi:hypothetical protein